MTEKKERKKDRAKRIALFSVLAVIAVLVSVPAISYGTAYIAGQGTTHSLQSDTAVQYAFGQAANASIPSALLATYANNVSIVDTHYFVATTVNPAGKLNGTLTEEYASTVYVITNITVAQLNDYAANTFVLNMTGAGLPNGTITMGYGNYVSNSSFVFNELEQLNYTVNGTQANLAFPVYAWMTTGNQSQDLMFELQVTNNISQLTTFSSFSYTGYIIGNHGGINGYMYALDAGLALGTVIPMVLVIFAIPTIRIRAHRDGEGVTPQRRSKKGKKKPKRGRK